MSESESRLTCSELQPELPVLDNGATGTEHVAAGQPQTAMQSEDVIKQLLEVKNKEPHEVLELFSSPQLCVSLFTKINECFLQVLPLGQMDVHFYMLNQCFKLMRVQQHNKLKQKLLIAFSLFGPPAAVLQQDSSSCYGYTNKQMSQVDIVWNSVSEAFPKDSTTDFAYLSVICVSVIEACNAIIDYPVFRVDGSNEQPLAFVDTGGKQYSDWDSFLKQNTLPKGLMLFPKDGRYLWFQEKKEYKEQGGEDDEQAEEQVDEEEHDEEIEDEEEEDSVLVDNPSGWCGETCMPTQLEWHLWIKFFLSVVSYWSHSFNEEQMAIISFLFSEEEGQHVDVLESHFKEFTAFGDFRQFRINQLQSPESRSALTKLFLACRKDGQTIVDFIQGLNKIIRPEDFFKLLSTNVGYELHQHKLKLTEAGLIEVNNELRIHPLKYKNLEQEGASTEFRKELLQAIRDLNEGNISKEDFDKQFKSILKKCRLTIESQKNDTIDKWKSELRVNNLSEFKLCGSGNNILSDLESHEIVRLGQVLDGIKNAFKKYSPDFYKEVLEKSICFASMNQCSNSSDFCSFIEYIKCKIDDLLKEKDKSIKSELEKAKKDHKEQYGKKKFTGRPSFDEKGFYINKGIPSKGSPNEPYRPDKIAFIEKTVMDKFDLDEICKEYCDCSKEVTVENQACYPRFKSDNAATYHYFKHKDFSRAGRGVLTIKEYFEVVKELFHQRDISERNLIMSQEGNVTFIEVKDDQGKVLGIYLDESFVKEDNVFSVATVYPIEK